MSFSWRLHPDNTGVELDQHERTFSSQSDAESWVGEHWRRLSEAGVQTVELTDGTNALYTMSLAAD